MTDDTLTNPQSQTTPVANDSDKSLNLLLIIGSVVLVVVVVISGAVGVGIWRGKQKEKTGATPTPTMVAEVTATEGVKMTSTVISTQTPNLVSKNITLSSKHITTPISITTPQSSTLNEEVTVVPQSALLWDFANPNYQIDGVVNNKSYSLVLGQGEENFAYGFSQVQDIGGSIYRVKILNSSVDAWLYSNNVQIDEECKSPSSTNETGTVSAPCGITAVILDFPTGLYYEAACVAESSEALDICDQIVLSISENE